MVEDVGGTETALKSLLSRLAEETVHLTAHLRRYAQRGTVVLGYEHRLDEFAVVGGEEVFYRTILGVLRVDGALGANIVGGFQGFAVLFRYVCHLVDTANVLIVKPFGHLRTGECRHASLLSHGAELVESQSEKMSFQSVHFFLYI